MEDFTSRPGFLPQTGEEKPSYLPTTSQQKSSILGWWYPFASPPEPAPPASFEAMERFRRGRTGSQIILALYFLLLISIPAEFVGTNIYYIQIVIGAFCALIVATALNRTGRVYTAGSIVVLTFIGVPVINIITTPGGLSMMVLPIFGLLVLPLLVASSFLPPWWVFIVALWNIIFTLLAFIYLPRTAELDAILAFAFAGIVIPIILTQIIVSIVAYLWVHGANQALLRADHAEELARLEHDLALQSEESSQQRQQLEISIQKIVETHMRAANGDLSARVPLLEGNVLWQISGPLNNLLARAQQWRRDASELQMTKLSLQQVQEELVALRRSIGR